GLASSGRKVRFLMYDPRVASKSCTLNLDPVCNVGPEFIGHDFRKGVQDVEHLIKQAGAHAANIEVRLTNWFLAWSAVAVDRSTEQGLLQIELYHYSNPYKVDQHLDRRVELLLEPSSRFYSG